MREQDSRKRLQSRRVESAHCMIGRHSQGRLGVTAQNREKAGGRDFQSDRVESMRRQDWKSHKETCTGNQKYICFLIHPLMSSSGPESRDMLMDCMEPLHLKSYGNWGAVMRELRERLGWAKADEAGKFYSHQGDDTWYYYVMERNREKAEEEIFKATGDESTTTTSPGDKRAGRSSKTFSERPGRKHEKANHSACSLSSLHSYHSNVVQIMREQDSRKIFQSHRVDSGANMMIGRHSQAIWSDGAMEKVPQPRPLAFCDESTTTTSPGILLMEMREQDGRGRHFQSDREYHNYTSPGILVMERNREKAGQSRKRFSERPDRNEDSGESLHSPFLPTLPASAHSLHGPFLQNGFFEITAPTESRTWKALKSRTAICFASIK
ncbi:hypothetical protein V8E54_006981 [Elaphomyces granulatus]